MASFGRTRRVAFRARRKRFLGVRLAGQCGDAGLVRRRRASSLKFAFEGDQGREGVFKEIQVPDLKEKKKRIARDKAAARQKFHLTRNHQTYLLTQKPTYTKSLTTIDAPAHGRPRPRADAYRDNPLCAASCAQVVWWIDRRTDQGLQCCPTRRERESCFSTSAETGVS